MKNNTIETHNLWLAAFLVARGYELLSTRREPGGGRVKFVFHASDEVSREIDDYMLGRNQEVNVHDFIAASARLKSLIYDGV